MRVYSTIIAFGSISTLLACCYAMDMEKSMGKIMTKLANGLRCDACEIELHAYIDILVHMDDKHPDYIFNKKCPCCCKTTTHLSNHMNKYSKDRHYECPICGQSVKWKSDKQRHLRAHELKAALGTSEISFSKCLMIKKDDAKIMIQKAKAYQKAIREADSDLMEDWKLSQWLEKEIGSVNAENDDQDKNEGGKIMTKIANGLRCNPCHVELQTLAQTMAHINDKHGEYVYKKCPCCCKPCRSRYRLGRHMMKHISEKQHVCPKCSQSWKSKCHLKAHLKEHELRAALGESKVMLKACVGSRQFEANVIIRMANEARVKHMKADEEVLELTAWLEKEIDSVGGGKHDINKRKIMTKIENGLRCNACDIELGTLSQTMAHIEENHYEYAYKMCPCCCKPCKGKYRLQDHMTKHLSEKRYKCPICIRPLKWKCNVYKHVRAHKLHAALGESTLTFKACMDMKRFEANALMREAKEARKKEMEADKEVEEVLELTTWLEKEMEDEGK